MSSYNKSIISKNDYVRKDLFYISEQVSTDKECVFLEEKWKEKMEKMNRELEERRKIEEKNMRINLEKQKDSLMREWREEALQYQREELYNELHHKYETIIQEEFQKRAEKLQSDYFRWEQTLKEEKDKIEKHKKNWLEYNRNEIVDILTVSVSKIISGITIEDNVVQQVLEDTIKGISSENKTIRIRIHPEHYQISNQNTWLNERVEWVWDPSLQIGEYDIETNTGNYDGTFNQKLLRLRKIIQDWVNDYGNN